MRRRFSTGASVGANGRLRLGGQLRRVALLAFLALAGGVPVGAQQDGVSPSGPVVTAVEVRSDAVLDTPQDLSALLAITPGDVLTDEAVRRTLQNLYATGLASQIEFYSRPEAGGVAAILVLWANVRVAEVRLAGDLGLKRVELQRALVQRPGEPLLEDRILRSLYRLQDLYQERGYFQARVRVDVATDAQRKRAVVTYEIVSGPRATIGEVAFEGHLGPFEPPQLIPQLQARPGEPYHLRTVRDDVDRLHQWLVGQGYRLASVDRPREEVSRESLKVDLTFPVKVGPLVRVEVRGADLRDLQKRGLLPFLDETGYDEALVLQAVDRLRRFYQERGHYQVEIDWWEERTPEELRLNLEIQPGPVFTLERVEFTGNQGVSDGELAALIETAPRRLLKLGSGRLVDEVLRRDLENIRSFYALQGFGKARVGPPEVQVEGHRLALVLPIHEGPRQRVADLSLEGAQSLEPQGLMKGLPIHPGGPYHPRLLEEALNLIRVRYDQRGYTSTQVSAEVDWSDDRTLAAVRIRVLEGPQTVVDRILVRGNRTTRAEVIQRATGLKPGEPVSGGRLLEVERNLYGLGIFSGVEVEFSPAAPGTSARDVVVRVEEGKVRSISYGLGYDSEDGVRGLFTYSHSNLAGRALTLRFDLRASERDRRARLLLDQPILGWLPAPVTYSLFRFEEERESFQVESFGVQAEAVRDFGRSRLGLLYNYRLVDLQVTSDAGIEPGEIEREKQEIQISSVTPNLLVDRRNDPFNPSRGWNSTVQLQYAFPVLDADADFLKLFFQQTAYLDLRQLGVVAGSFRAGAIEPLGTLKESDLLTPRGLPSRDVPIAERFFAGGRTSHRAYQRDLLGIRGETLLEVPRERGGSFLAPVGGNGLLLLNLDYRFPIAGPIGGTVFIDTGNVWPDWREMALREFKSGVGVGIRYLSPIGPLRLEIGWKLDREPGEDPAVVFLSFGNPF